MTEKHGRATPANWPNNKIFWNKVIVPPASNLSQMKENISKYEHKDWYICTEEKPN
jgi:peroxiredoxin (alkyl hydroperoxide reductase subunit C)